MSKDIKTKKQYDVYFKKMRKGGKQPMTFYHWKKSGRSPVYFKGLKRTRDEAHLSRKYRKRLGLPD